MHPHRSSASSTGAVSRPPIHPSWCATPSPMRAVTQVPGALVEHEATARVSVWVGTQRGVRFGDELVQPLPRLRRRRRRLARRDTSAPQAKAS